jgi:FKBP-type peptidyl-prolyl cis-trans isomerase SlyD
MAAETKLTVADELVVGLDYTLRFDDGQVVDTSTGEESLEILQGHGNVVSGLEHALYGMAVGDEKEVIVAPNEGYGDYDPKAFQVVSRDSFPDTLNLTEGMGLHMRDSQTGEVLQVHVSEIRPDGVMLDLNHPLAGETLHFVVKISDLRQATQEELAHGHAHGAGDQH